MTAADAQRGTHSRHHHGSHGHLLRPARPAVALDVDAIIVPTIRAATAMRSAIALAGKLNSTLVALCSGNYSSPEKIAELAKGEGVKLIALDTNRLPDEVVPKFATSALLAGTKYARWTDLAYKRNFGLLLARVMGWQRIVFLDDDIDVPEPMDLCHAAGLTTHYAGVGLAIGGYPDNSVVCHAFREAGGKQDSFIGGGALAVDVPTTTSFFPNIYNEDWFFLLDDDGMRPTTITGRAIQKPYDPFANDQRARLEELGDCLAEGIYWLLDGQRPVQEADFGHWQRFLRHRTGFITEVIEMVEKADLDPALRSRMLRSVKAARGRCQSIRPELCVEYVKAWRADRVTWREHLDEVLRAQVTDKGKAHEQFRSLAGAHGLLRSLGLPDAAFRLSLPRERLDQDAADLDPLLPVAVGE